MTTLAAETPTGSVDPISLIIGYGPLGAIIVLGIFGYIYLKPAVDNLKEERDRALAERDKADDQRDAMAATFQKELLPVLTKFLTTTEALLPLLQRMVDKAGGDQR